MQFRINILLTLFAVFAMGSNNAVAQDITVSGTVVYASDHEPLAGAYVVPVGGGQGVCTDADGSFVLTVPASVRRINVSYVGLAPKLIEVMPDAPVTIPLTVSSAMLDEVVVAAFGEKRDRKGLGYAVQDLKSEDLNTMGTTSLTDAMMGKLSGVQIRPSSGAPGASSNITIRGVRSFSDNNSPLYVIDGMPVESTPDVVQSSTSMVRNASYADRSIDINPDDIESISVLKGQAAAALYGIRASNGVIVITTKRGRRSYSSKPIISVSTDMAAVRVSRRFHRQEIYAQGSKGAYNPTSTTSWGPKISDLPDDANYGGNTDNTYTREYGLHPGMYYSTKRAQAGLDGWTYPAVYDNAGEFLSGGFTENANFSISQRIERVSYAFGLNNSHQSGVVKSTSLDRWGARGALDWEFGPEWGMGFTANYVRTSISSAPEANSGITNIVYSAPAEYDLKGIPSSQPGNPSTQVSFNSNFNNPYWWSENNAYRQLTQRFIGNAYAEYRPSGLRGSGIDLVIKEQLGVDAYTSRYNNIQELGSKGNVTGYVENRSYTRQVFNNLLTANLNVRFGHDMEWEAGLLAGSEISNDKLTSSVYAGSGLTFFGRPVIDNCSAVTTASESPSQQRTVGLFFNATASWRDMLFLNVTGRNDWVSSMPRGHRSFFYPSVSMAWVFTDIGALKGNRTLTFGKVRVSYAEVGEAANYVDNFAYIPVYGGGFYRNNPLNYPIKGVNSYVPYPREYDPDLRPQTTKNWELGTDFRFFDDRVRLNYTYSYQDVCDQIFQVPMDGATGYQSVMTNGGRITTNTHEVDMSLLAYSTRDLSVDIGVNWTRYKSKVRELAPGVDNVMLGGFTEPQVRAAIGYGYPVIYGNSVKRDEATGLMLLNANGTPVTNGAPSVIGDCTPDFTMGWSTDIRYRRLRLSTTWSWQKGGQMYHGTLGVMRRDGVTADTSDRGPVHVSGLDVSSLEAVEYDVDRQTWNNAYYSVSENYVVDADCIKLRDITLSYQLPRIGMFDIGVYGFARNVLVWARMPYFDPESSLGNNNAGGYFERYSLPSTASFGGGLKLTF